MSSGILVLGPSTDPVAAEPVTRPIVLELFISLGCSSCPPADVLLAKIVQAPDGRILAAAPGG